jgi:hypothetical protein
VLCSRFTHHKELCSCRREKNPNKFKKKIQKYSKRNEELVTTNSWFEKHGLEILLKNINQPQINAQVPSPSTLKNEAC